MNGFDAAIESIYSAALGGGAWSGAIDRFCDAIGSRGLIVNPVRLDRPGMLLFSDDLLSAVEDYERHWRPRDPRVRAGLQQKVGEGIVTDRVLGISEADRARDPFYQEFLRPIDIGCFAAYVYRTADGQVYSVSAQRELGRGEFGESELTDIVRLGRHLVRALDLAPRAAWAVAHSGSLVAGFDGLGHGLMTIDRQGRVVALNRAAEHLMLTAVERNGRAGHGQLRPLGHPEFERFVVAVQAWLFGGAMVEPAVIGRPSGPRLLLQMLPAARLAETGAGSAERSSAVISIYDLGAMRSASAVDLLVRNGLTSGEARVAAEIGAGRSPREAAVALGLAEATVRSVLKTVFAKLGLRKQSELAVLVSGLRAARIAGE